MIRNIQVLAQRAGHRGTIYNRENQRRKLGGGAGEELTVRTKGAVPLGTPKHRLPRQHRSDAE